MNLCMINHSFRYELEKLCRIFLPFEKIVICDAVQSDRLYAVCTLRDDRTVATAELFWQDRQYSETERIGENTLKAQELGMARCLYRCFVAATGYRPGWGLLTGVRPVKLYAGLLNTIGQEETDRYFRDRLYVSEEKISLCAQTVEPEHAIVARNRRNSFSLYVSVPFCPSRCSYCSFVSHSIDKAGNLIGDYVEKLCEELCVTGALAKKLGLKCETVYIGGGTPTALTAEQLTTVMRAVRENFDLSDLSEYTVEAGRPDVTTAEKLMAIQLGGATRISINPQTMNDDVLEAIGRRHTAKQVEDAFLLARSLGFHNINMDLIAGLPTDTFESFKQTIDRILALDPESVTVHALSMKRSSRLTVSGELPEIAAGQIASQMVGYARKVFTDAGILPYYMYRQSKTVGNLENVGYAKPGFEGLYNVYIMDETHTILACGASAVTKMRQPGGDYIERIFNYKYPYEYLSRFDEMIRRKEGVEQFYDQYPV